ncbi:hypothetical protein HGRIS_012990 [Hohenbuehelia grisea]|uniref:C2H2-type domain-containing protein n=1 Tax=Hohenbuehelia grisea TaxID=104357 RepID=A0ABR3IU33_9AGAR
MLNYTSFEEFAAANAFDEHMREVLRDPHLWQSEPLRTASFPHREGYDLAVPDNSLLWDVSSNVEANAGHNPGCSHRTASVAERPFSPYPPSQATALSGNLLAQHSSDAGAFDYSSVVPNLPCPSTPQPAYDTLSLPTLTASLAAESDANADAPSGAGAAAGFHWSPYPVTGTSRAPSHHGPQWKSKIPRRTSLKVDGHKAEVRHSGDPVYPMEIHIESYDPVTFREDTDGLECACRRTFNDWNGFRRHLTLNSAHVKDSRKSACAMCGKRFARSENLARHSKRCRGNSSPAIAPSNNRASIEPGTPAYVPNTQDVHVTGPLAGSENLAASHTPPSFDAFLGAADTQSFKTVLPSAIQDSGPSGFGIDIQNLFDSSGDAVAAQVSLDDLFKETFGSVAYQQPASSLYDATPSDATATACEDAFPFDPTLYPYPEVSTSSNGLLDNWFPDYLDHSHVDPSSYVSA